jgi:tetratricopeptide (TPR) repeat protein
MARKNTKKLNAPNKPLAKQHHEAIEKKIPEPSSTQSTSTWWTNTVWQSIIIFFCSGLLYINTLSHQYAQDDAIVLYDNMFTTKGLEGIPGIFQYDTFYGFFKEEGKANLVAGGRYRPLSLVLFAVGWEFFGNNPMIYHLMNVFWYALTCLMLYWLILRMLSWQQDKLQVHFIAFATALLFAAHPIHTEAVANIKGRDEILTLLGSLTALYAMVRAYDEKKIIWLAFGGFSFLLALLAKENAITFLAVVPLTFWVFRKAKLGATLLYTLPLLTMAIIFLALRAAVLGFNFSEPTKELMNNPYLKIENNEWVAFSFLEWSATIMFTLGKYIALLFFPHPLTHDYYPRHVDIMQWNNWQVLLSAAAYVGLLGYALMRLPKRDWVSYGILFYLITLSIVSNIVFPIGTNMGERFIFMPSIGFCFVIVVLIWRLNEYWSKPKQDKQIRLVASSFIILGLLLLPFSYKTIIRNSAWKDNFTLFTTDIEVSQNSAKLRNGVAGVLIEQGTKEINQVKQQQYFQEAIGHLKEAVKIHPTYQNAYLLMGNAYNFLRQYETSIAYYEQALRINPNYKDAQQNLAITYRDAGRYYGQELNNPVKSIEFLEKANTLQPNNWETLRLLGIAYGVSGQTTKAINYLEQANALSPNNASVLYNLGAAYGSIGEIEKANTYMSQAKALDPSIGNN